MTTVDFYFDNLSRTGDDKSTMSQKNIMNQHQSNYSLYNPYSYNCNGALDISTQQPSLMINGTYGVGPLGCNVEQSSDLLRSKNTTNNIKISLHQRSYLSLPYLGRGNVDVGAENELKFGETFKDKKSVVQMSELQFLNINNYPLKNKDIGNKISTVEASWYTGANTRDIYKENNNSCK
jgi:hypothetical protein